MSKISLILLFALIVNGCSSAQKSTDNQNGSTKDLSTTSPFDQKMNNLESKMPLDKVREILGSPDTRELQGDVEVWHYSAGDGRYVEFRKGKVYGFGRDLSKSIGTNTLQPPSMASNLNNRVNKSDITPTSSPDNPLAVTSPTPEPEGKLDIGASCTKDSQCAGKNCHFKRCAGKNNCTQVNGEMCANDAGCCSGFCDFGICRQKR